MAAAMVGGASIAANSGGIEEAWSKADLDQRNQSRVNHLTRLQSGVKSMAGGDIWVPSVQLGS